MEEEKRQKCSPRARCIIILCWIAFTCSYIGKLGYTANIVPIENAYNISHGKAGLVSTFFFFAYGAGQIVNGLFCRKYNLRWLIPAVLFVSAGCNAALVFLPVFAPVKYLWLLDGAALSVLWPSIVRFLSENLSDSDLARATVVMGTSTAVGTFVTYGLSALFVALGAYKIIFVSAACLLPVIGTVWFLLHNKLTLPQKEKSPETSGEQPSSEERSNTGKGGFAVLMGAMAVFAVITNLVKDGLNTWVPNILKELYALPDFMSILLTLALPLCAIFGTMAAVALHKKIAGLTGVCAVLFAVTTAAIGAVIAGLNVSLVFPLAGFALVACMMSGSNAVITTMMPLSFRGMANSGLWAGVLNGCCYVGSTISSYGLGSLADAHGWNAVCWLLFSLSAFVLAAGTVLSLVQRAARKKRSAVK